MEALSDRTVSEPSFFRYQNSSWWPVHGTGFLFSEHSP